MTESSAQIADGAQGTVDDDVVSDPGVADGSVGDGAVGDGAVGDDVIIADGAADGPADGYAKALGTRLRAIRLQQHLSLHGVERKSGGRWKAVVVGSYERGDRAVSVQRLAELADFYGVPISDLLPADEHAYGERGGATPLSRIVLNIDKVHNLTDAHAEGLRRFVSAILRQRGDLGVHSLPVRYEDLSTLALMYDTSIEALTDRLVRWQVLAPESVIVDSTV